MQRLTGRRLQRLRAAVRDQQPFCVACLKHGTRRAWDELDHILPLHKGGTNDLDNLQGLCTEHHAAKTADDMGHRDASCDANGQPLNPNHHWNTQA